MGEAQREGPGAEVTELAVEPPVPYAAPEAAGGVGPAGEVVGEGENVHADDRATHVELREGGDERGPGGEEYRLRGTGRGGEAALGAGVPYRGGEDEVATLLEAVSEVEAVVLTGVAGHRGGRGDAEEAGDAEGTAGPYCVAAAVGVGTGAPASMEEEAVEGEADAPGAVDEAARRGPAEGPDVAQAADGPESPGKSGAGSREKNDRAAGERGDPS